MAQLVTLFGVQTLKPTIDNNFSLVYNSNVRSENVNEVRILVDTSLQVVPAQVNIYLPPTIAYNGIYTTQIYIVDVSGTASTNAIRIYATSGDNIDGSAYKDLTTAYGNVVLTIASQGYYTSYGSGGSGGGGGGGGVTLPYADFFNLITNNQLVVGQTYRINDYRNVNLLNGITQANSPFVLNPLNAGILDATFTAYDLSGNPLQFVQVLPDNTIFTADGVGVIRKLDVNGNSIDSYNNIVQTQNGAILSIAVQSDGKIVVGGTFILWGATPVGRLVRLNTDGTLDATFNTNLGSGFDNQVYDVNIQADGKILVGGSMLTLNGNPIAPYFTRLNSDGTLDVAFDGALGTGFDNIVQSITIQSDNNILLGGSFLSLNANPSNYLIRIDPNAVIDAVFVANLNFAGGLNSQVIQTIEQPDTSILVLGYFTLFNGIPYNYFLRIDSFGNDDFGFNANTGTGLNGFPYAMALQTDGSILVCGNFSQFNGNNVGSLVRVDSFGTYDTSFTSVFSSSNTLFYVGLQSSGKSIVGGNFNISPQKYIARIIDTSSIPDFDFDAIYTSPIIETLVVKALTTSSIEQVVYSEQYPDDVIEYIAECNTIGKNLPLYNGVTLPDSTILAGFDLQWDGTNAYFDMPTGYPAQYGHYFYIYANFNSGKSVDILCEPLKSGNNITPTIIYGDLGTAIGISNNQTKIVIYGLTQADVLDYVASSLYVDTIQALATAYGCISKRTDTMYNVSIPFDYRGVRYRRYQFDLQIPVLSQSINFGVGYWGLNPQTLGNGFTGLYEDFGWSVNYTLTNVNFNAVGGADNTYWYMGVDNNVCINDCINLSLDCGSNPYNNTFGILNNSSISIKFFYENIISQFFDNSINIYTISNNFIIQFIGCRVYGDEIVDNRLSALQNCNITSPTFNFNSFSQSINSTIFNDDFASNSGTSQIFNNTLGYMQGNIIQTADTFNNNTIRYAENNNIQSLQFSNNTIETFNVNTFTNTSSFVVNIIDVAFNDNEISNQFSYNSIGSFFNANLVNAEFLRNTLLEEAIGNSFTNRFNDNQCGSKFNGNILTGFFELNIFGNQFNGNQITCNNFSNNIWIGSGIQANLFTNNASNIRNNFISASFQNNQFSGSLMEYNSISGFTLNSNLFQGTIYNNNIVGGMSSCTTAIGSTFQKNAINDLCSGIDFSLATHVYQTYNCTIQEGNLNNILLSYLDEGTLTYVFVLPTA